MKPETESMAALCGWLAGQDDFVLLDTARVTGEEKQTLLFTTPERWLTCAGPEQADAFMEELAGLEEQGAHLAGWFGYEFGCLLESSLRHLVVDNVGPFAVIGVFGPPLVIGHPNEDFVQRTGMEDSDAQEEDICGLIRDIRTSIDEESYLAALDRIKEYIAAGDTYQVNYTLKLKFLFDGAPEALYLLLRQRQAVSYGAWIRQGGRDIMSFSPELFFRSGSELITVRPMKGTMSRGKILAEDLARREVLREDVKNRSENVMIVDLLRNDLGRLLHNTGGGTVRPRSLFDVEVYDTLLQMTSTIEGVPKAGKVPSLSRMLKALFPCGSVTGAPKIRTMEIIHELEKEPRGVYCGAIGYSSSGSTVFNVPIRTLVLEDGAGEMGIGSGIVFDSDPEAEWQETLLKGRFLSASRPEFQLIETLLWQPEPGYWLLEEHMERLARSAAYFLFGLSGIVIRAALNRTAEEFTAPMRVRLLLFRDGSFSINAAEHTGPLPESPEIAFEPDPLPTVVLSAQRTNRENVHLYHKTTARDLYIRERQAALAEGYYEVLFLNREGEVTEGSITNIFVRQGGRLLTPPAACGLLAGTFRRRLLERDRAEEQVLTRDDLLGAEAVYVGNSVRGLVRVTVQPE